VFQFDMAMFQSHEFVVGTIVAAILLSALFGSALFRNIGLAFAAGALVVVYLQGGIPTIMAISKSLETEFRAIPDFTTGLLVGGGVVSALLLGLRPKTST